MTTRIKPCITAITAGLAAATGIIMPMPFTLRELMRLLKMKLKEILQDLLIMIIRPDTNG